MSNIFLVFILAAGSAMFCWNLKKRLLLRTQMLEADLKRMSDAVIQLAEIQMRSHEKSAVRLEDMESRIMELSVPSQDSILPLERRHQVLALARQGVALEEIVKRLKAPIGEAELILNLRKYTGRENSPSGKPKRQAKQYA